MNLRLHQDSGQNIDEVQMRLVPPRTDNMRSFFRLLMTLCICIIGTSFSFSCSRRPSLGDYLVHVSTTLDCYIHTNAIGAEVAMLDLEKYTKKCERAGLYEINFDQHYTAIYSRLYLIQIALENQTNAAKYYQLAKEHWQKFNLEDKTHLPQSIDQQIKGVDRYFERPAWRTGSD